MNAEPARRSQRRRPDLSVNTSRAHSLSRDTQTQPPVSPPRRKAPVPSSRTNSRSGPKPPPTSLGTAAMASTVDTGGRTPRARASSHAAANSETFLEMYTPVAASSSAGKENSAPMANAPPMPGPRDSHDLSLPSRHVRDSLVSNMLLSLDQFSMGQIGSPTGPGPAHPSPPSFDDHRLYSLSTNTTDDFDRAPHVPTAARGRPGGRYAYNYSSDYEAPDDTSRVSGSISHSRRSNSSSGFQSSLGRINSMRESSTHRGSQPGTPHMMHSRGGKGSKSSSTNSIDAGGGYAQVLGSQRWAHGFGGRSSSFDLGPRPLGTSSGHGSSANHPPTAMAQQPQQPQQQQQQQQQQQPWHIEFSDTFFRDAYDDAAPTPTVPAGPRKLTSAPSMPSMQSYQPPPPDPPAAPERRRSVRSSRSATAGRQAQAKFSTAPPPPLPSFDFDSAPAPNIGYEKSKEAVPPAATPQQPHPLREKQSFFRRVFGSFRDTVSGNEPAPLVPSAPTNAGFLPAPASFEADTARGHQHSSAGLKVQSTPPSRDSLHSSHATLQKKPSGFFRRRKKSISELESPPPLPMPLVLPQHHQQQQLQQQQQQQQQQQKQQPPLPMPRSQSGPLFPATSPSKTANARNAHLMDKAALSPSTSLRRAMSPYLKGSPAFPHGYPEQHLDDAVQDDIGISAPRSQQSGDDSKPLPPVGTERSELDEADLAGRTARGFSPDYEPPPTATIRPVEPDQNGKLKGVDRQNSQSQRSRLETPTRLPPAPPHPARSGSFLSDDSESEESPRNIADKVAASQRAAQQDSQSQLSLSLSPPDERHLSPQAGSLRPEKNASKKSTGGTDDDSEFRGSKISLLIEGAGAAPVDGAGAATSAALTPSSRVQTPTVRIENEDALDGAADGHKTLDEPGFVVGQPTEDDRQKALNIFQGNSDFIQKEKAAAWMGEEGPVRQRTLQAYMDLYDFRNQSIVSALREVCSRLILRAETQQVDRILVAFSKRWSACNPNHGFKSIDVVHTTCYSIMLLNTDLHLADIESKMTRSQFIKNTMTSIQHTLAEASLHELDGRTAANGVERGRRPSVDQDRSLAVSSALPPRSESSLGNHDDCGPLVKAPCDGPMRVWESQMEVVLKIIYASIRDERLPLFGAESANSSGPTPSQSGLSVIGMLKRTPSVLSKTPSDSQVSMRGRLNEPTARAGSSRWASKSRSRVRGPTLGGPNGISSSRTSFDDGNSVWSPSVSSATWSRQSLGRTQTSMSMESFGSTWNRGEYQQSIGFANALSQAIIREDALLVGSSAQSLMSDDQSAHQKDGGHALLDDESLELAGPPWVKEGMVIHKHHLDGIDKRAKDRNWAEVFAVVQKGQMSLFSFTPNKSLRAKNRGRHNAPLPKGAVVGGGNWQENATNLGTFVLKQTLASALPSPGYSRQRPHVWALSLPTGAVHLFQVGTPEICKEFVTTANYWSARLSTHPLVGGISNIEYGWGESLLNNALVTAVVKSESTTALPSTAGGGGGGGNSNSSMHGPYPPSASRPGSAAAGRASMQSRSSFRSGSFDFGHVRSGSSSSGFTSNAANSMGLHGSGGRHGKLPGDRIHIAEWMPPTQSLRSSSAAEPQQLQTLLAYVQSIEADLQAHTALRSPMLLAFTTRGHNANKAMANWERKSAYLLREIVKYRTYVDCLTEAERRRREIHKEREIARRAARGEEIQGTDGEENVNVRTDGDAAANNDDDTDADDHVHMPEDRQRRDVETTDSSNGDDTLRA